VLKIRCERSPPGRRMLLKSKKRKAELITLAGESKTRREGKRQKGFLSDGQGQRHRGRRGRKTEKILKPKKGGEKKQLESTVRYVIPSFNQN